VKDPIDVRQAIGAAQKSEVDALRAPASSHYMPEALTMEDMATPKLDGW